MMNELLTRGDIPQRLGPILRDIFPLLNQGIHEGITQKEAQFVREVVQDIIVVLREIE